MAHDLDATPTDETPVWQGYRFDEVAQRWGGLPAESALAPDDPPTQDLRWLDLNRMSPRTQAWLTSESRLEPTVAEALLEEQTRPREIVSAQGLLVILRGANFNDPDEPEDMLSVRVWCDAHRVLTLRRYRMRAAEDVQAAIQGGQLAGESAAVLVMLVESLTQRLEPVLDGIYQLLDEFEDAVESPSIRASRAELSRSLSKLQRQAIRFRRYLSPQRDVLARLSALDSLDWLNAPARRQLSKLANDLTRHVEDLDALRARAEVLDQELGARQNDRLNRKVYRLSVLAGLFLPITALTGLLGINVGGIPGSDHGTAFWWVCAALTGLLALEVWTFRWLRWLD